MAERRADGADRADRADGADAEWWRGAVIYQIYPRSFRDSDGDGVGDLKGIAERLEHVRDLGADAVWLSPFYRSPMADFGYDISDYRDVDPIFGRLADFDGLVARAHDLGLKVLVDQVLSHSSDEHEWFRESRQSRDNPRSDWYVWADAAPDGSPPNNWLAQFGGVAWDWEPRRRQYYLHNFHRKQPDLNLHHPPVQEAVLDVLRFWLERGVDGFRLDVINFLFHDRALASNPPSAQQTDGGLYAKPVGMQRMEMNTNRPETPVFMERVRAVLDEYGAIAMGEMGSAYDRGRLIAEYTAPGRLQTAYSFELLTGEGSAAHFSAAANEALEAGGSTAWAVSNHDVARVASRWSAGDERRAAPLWTTACLSLEGPGCLYQGEELGLPEADVPFERIVDPEGIEFWPDLKGRDGARTPFPWGGNAHAGFGTPEGTETWLPVDPRHDDLSVERQRGDRDSPLERITRFLHWRRARPELRRGAMRVRHEGDVLVIERMLDGDPDGEGGARTWIALNCSATPATLRAPDGARDLGAAGHEGTAALEDGTARLEPWGALFAAL